MSLRSCSAFIRWSVSRSHICFTSELIVQLIEAHGKSAKYARYDARNLFILATVSLRFVP